MFTCSDSRIDPSLFTQSKPGEIFVVRNPGNIAPKESAVNGGEAAAVAFALNILKIKNIVICGHSDCGAMAALNSRDESLTAMTRWLSYAKNDESKQTQPLEKVVKANILYQVENLKGYAPVKKAISCGEIFIYAWYYDLGQQTVDVYAPKKKEFLPALSIDLNQSSFAADFNLA